jgi:FLVCR family MFS transporter 7
MTNNFFFFFFEIIILKKDCAFLLKNFVCFMHKEFEVYSYRWYILAIYSTLVFSNALLWVTFAPISDISAHYFSGVYGTSTAINMLANVFLIMYLPGTILAVFSMKYYGLKTTFVIAIIATTFGSLLRYIATLIIDTENSANGYTLMIIGQIFPALAQPAFLNLAPALADTWFATNERDKATTIGTMFSPIGNAFGQVLPVLFVSQSILSKF